MSLQNRKENKIMYKKILAGFSIFAAGLGLGFFIGKRKYELYYSRVATEEINSVIERFGANECDHCPIENGKLDPNDEEYDRSHRETHPLYEDVATPTNPTGPLTRSSVRINPYEQAKIDYNRKSMNPADIGYEQDEQPETDISEEDEPDDGHFTDAAGKDEQDMQIQEVEVTLPYLISSDQYGEDAGIRDKMSLYYYKLDDTLCDEQDEVVDDIEETCGYDALSALEMQTMVWVRNEPLLIDYEIIAVNDSYRNSVLGLMNTPNLTPREQYERREKRKEQHAKQRK